MLSIITRLVNWNTNRKRKIKRLIIYNKFVEGRITYDEYVEQRKNLEKQFKNK